MVFCRIQSIFSSCFGSVADVSFRGDSLIELTSVTSTSTALLVFYAVPVPLPSRFCLSALFARIACLWPDIDLVLVHLIVFEKKSFSVFWLVGAMYFFWLLFIGGILTTACQIFKPHLKTLDTWCEISRSQNSFNLHNLTIICRLQLSPYLR